MFRKVFFVILFLSILIIYGGFKFNKNKYFMVTGKALMLKNSQKSIEIFEQKSIPIIGAKILAAKGKFLADPLKVSIPVNLIRSTKMFSLTDHQGVFEFKLSRGVYTFFIIIDNQAYLNNFDGKGNFSSREINVSTNDIILFDDRDVLY